MGFSHTVATALLLLGSTSAHVIMATPKPYGVGIINNSPLSSANYPCQYPGSGADTFYARTDTTAMPVGVNQTLSFTGEAVHQGGSCQLAITKSLTPDPSTHWEVILSIEGGCPSTTGNGPSTYEFAIPEGTATGSYSLAWTWISKEAGSPELYMNCAPIEVTAGTSKRSLNSSMEIEPLMKRDALPDLWVGNIAGINDACKTKQEPENDPLYPNPGPNVMKASGTGCGGITCNFVPIPGSSCCPQGQCQGGTGGNSTSTPASSAVISNPGSAPTPTTTGNGASALSVGFATGTASTSATSFVTSVIAASSSAAPLFPNTTSTVATTSAAAATASTPAIPATNSSSSAGGMTGPCTSEGMFNCVDSQYQQCASGSWTSLQPLAAGTSCKQGQSMTLWSRRAKRAIRVEDLY